MHIDFCRLVTLNTSTPNYRDLGKTGGEDKQWHRGNGMIKVNLDLSETTEEAQYHWERATFVDHGRDSGEATCRRDDTWTKASTGWTTASKMRDQTKTLFYFV